MKRIFMTGISQESNSSNPLLSRKTDFAMTRGEEFRAMPGSKVLIEAGFEVVESVWARAVPGGTLAFADFMEIVEEMLKPLIEDRQGFDGVFLPLHGALDVEHIGSGEAYLANRVREYVGPDVPIAAAMDMHGNLMYSFCQSVNIVYGYRTAPHIDVAQTHIRAAQLLVKAVNENVLPHTRLLRIPYMMPGENMMTASGIGKEIIDFLPSIEEKPGTWCSSYFVGMAWIDCPQNGAAIVVSGTGEMDEAMEKSKELAQMIMDRKDEFHYQGTALKPMDGIEFAKKQQGDGLVILSDSADNITAGAAGDNAYVLSLFLEAQIKNALFSSIIDPLSVETLSNYKVGDTVTIEIGGAFDKASTKVKLEGAKIKHLVLDKVENAALLADDKPRSAVLSYEGIDVLLFDKRKPVFSEEVLNENGLSIHDYDIVVVKQGYLEPEFNGLKKHSALLYTTGNCDQRIERLNFKKLRRPMYPYDALESIPNNRLFEVL